MDVLMLLEKLMEMTEIFQTKSRLELKVQLLELSKLVICLNKDIIKILDQMQNILKIRLKIQLHTKKMSPDQFGRIQLTQLQLLSTLIQQL